MRELYTEIEIEAPPSTVWKVLMEFEAYSEWNPFIPQLLGKAVDGAKLEVKIHPPGGSATVFRPTVQSVKEEGEFRWLGHLLIPGLFDGLHIFELHKNGNETTRFVQREEFRGVLVPLFWRMLDTKTRQGFIAMNEALKQRVETT